MIALALLAALAVQSTEGARIFRRERDPNIEAARAKLVEGRPELRGWRAPLLERAREVLEADAVVDPRAKELVRTKLAREGLLATLAAVIDVLGAQSFVDGGDERVLRACGLPTDLFAHFAAPEGALVPWIAKQIVASSLDGARAKLQSVRFAFRPTVAGFELASESGEHEPALLRAQLSSGEFYRGEGDGSAVDLLRSLSKALPNVDLAATIEEKHAEALLAALKPHPFARPTQLTLLVEPFPVAQWAQDNGKSGIATDGASRRVVTLVPRYASRGEDGAAFVRGETFALESFAALGHEVVQSPLLFQGGNVLVARDAQSGGRILFLGEAEVWRNTALGLARDQVIEAFKREFAVDRAFVLPATSFHVDFELSVRATDSGLVAFLNDTPSASRLVLGAAADALERGGKLAPEAAAIVREELATGQFAKSVEAVVGALGGDRPRPAFPESFTKVLEAGPSDSGVGNLQRVLAATDFFSAMTLDGQEQAKLDIDRHAAAYLFSLRRREMERIELARTLEREGFRIVRVPSTSEERLSLCALNGLQIPGRYLMPAYGGLFANVDAAAKAAFEQALPGVEVVLIPTGETQRRAGALHCAVSVVPAVE